MPHRLSREKIVYNGSLKGMPAKIYYFVQAILQPKSVLSKAARYLDDGLWTKFDRNKPISQRQAAKVLAALNKTLMDDTPDFPFNIAVARLGSRAVLGMTKRVYYIREICTSSLQSMPTELGNAYIPDPDTKLKYQDQEGIVTFSRHAIERMMERIPNLTTFCLEQPLAPVIILGRAIRSIPEHGAGLMLPVLPFGYFPVVFAPQNVWVCTSFLTPEMDGTPRENRKEDPTLSCLHDDISEMTRQNAKTSPAVKG